MVVGWFCVIAQRDGAACGHRQVSGDSRDNRDSSTAQGTASQLPQPNALRCCELQVFLQKHPGSDMTQGVIQAPEHKCVVTQLSIHYSGHTLSGES